MNQWSGIGNLMRNPVSYVNESGIDICKFSINVNRPHTESGDILSDVVPIRAEKRLAALCREYLRKGRKVGVVGQIRTYFFTDHEGETRSGFYVKVEDITFLPSGKVDKPELGDIHSDDGCLHHEINFDLDFLMQDGVSDL